MAALDKINVTGEMERLRSNLLRALVDLAPRENRSYAEDLLVQIETANRMLEASKAKSRGIVFRRAIDAIQYVLDREGALPEDELVNAVLELGFGAGESDLNRRANVMRSIGQYTAGVAGTRKKVIKQVGTLIGRGDWPDEKFR